MFPSIVKFDKTVFDSPGIIFLIVSQNALGLFPDSLIIFMLYLLFAVLIDFNTLFRCDLYGNYLANILLYLSVLLYATDNCAVRYLSLFRLLTKDMLSLGHVFP